MAVKAARASKPKEREASWLKPQGALQAAAQAQLAFVEAVRRGLPIGLVDRVVGAGYLTLAEINQLVLPARTLAHRRQHDQPLSPEESDRFARVLRLVALAEETFGDSDKARLWLRRPNRALEGRDPLDLLDTDGGARAVETILGRIGYGVYS
jgi:putative toxin-antitoxin system antitoxin component (TIGR02293 family)